MKIKKNYLSVSEYRTYLTIQINRLLDYLLNNDNYEEDLKLKAEIKDLRQKYKLAGDLAYAKITNQIEIEELTLESKMNDTDSELKPYKFSYKSALATSYA